MKSALLVVRPQAPPKRQCRDVQPLIVCLHRRQGGVRCSGSPGLLNLFDHRLDPVQLVHVADHHVALISNDSEVAPTDHRDRHAVADIDQTALGPVEIG